MKSLLDKIFSRSNNLDYVSRYIKDLTKKTPAHKIFEAIKSYSSNSEVRYVGGCIRKIIKKEKVDDIDLATNLEPDQVCKILKQKKIDYYETGIEHGTITALIDNYKFEITTLRKDIFTDGRHAKVQFSQNWKDDASRRDFTINSIYSDEEGNLFDPFDGKKDLDNGYVNFIGEADLRIKEDYLRILRYIRFFINYSNQPHSSEITSKLRKNLVGVAKLSKDRLYTELKKIIKLENLIKLSKDKLSLELILFIFPELKNFNIFKKLDLKKKEILKDVDFIFLLSLLIVDETDNVDYFLYKYNISNKDNKRIKHIHNFFKEKINSKTFAKKNIDKYFYYEGYQAVKDVLIFKIIKSKMIDKSLLDLCNQYKNKPIPKMPIGADFLMKKYRISEGKQLGLKLKKIEEAWVNNNFNISDQQIDNIVQS